MSDILIPGSKYNSKACSELHGDLEAASPFINNQRKTSFFEPRKQKVIAATTQSNKCVYDVDPHSEHHFLENAAFNFELPAINVKTSHSSKLQICWCKNIGINIINRVSLEKDEKELAHFTNHSLEYKMQFYFYSSNDGARKRELFNQSIGNSPELIEFSSSVPEYEIISEIPFFINDCTMFSLPLRKLYPGIYKKLNMVTKFNLDISKLLRVRELRENDFSPEWVEVPLTTQHLSLLEGVPQDGKLSVPFLRCQFFDIGSNTVDYLRCSPEPERTFYVDAYKQFRSEQSGDLGGMRSIVLRSSNPVNALMWSMVNETAAAKNDLSCHTTSTGRIPIKDNSLTYYDERTREVPVFSEETSAQFYRGDSLKRFPSAPTTKGLLGWVPGVRTGTPDGDTELEFHSSYNYTLTCNLVSPTPEEANEKFSLIVVTCEKRKIQIIQNEEEETYKLEIDNWNDSVN